MTGVFRRSTASRVLLPGALLLAFSATPAQAANATSFSGEATVVDMVTRLPPTGELVAGHAGPLPPSGGEDEDQILDANIGSLDDPPHLTASVIRATTEGGGSTALSVARAVDLYLYASSRVEVSDTTVRSNAIAVCGMDGAEVAGGSIIDQLLINGEPVGPITGAPNQEFRTGSGLVVVVNEQVKNVSADGTYGEITVNAVRVTHENLSGDHYTEVVLASTHADVTCPARSGVEIAPEGAIGGPCADPAYYGIFDNTASSVSLVFRFRWNNGSLRTIRKTVPAGAIFRTWEHWAKPGTALRVAYKNPTTGKWLTLASDVAVKGTYPRCEYKRGFEYPNP